MVDKSFTILAGRQLLQVVNFRLSLTPFYDQFSISTTNLRESIRIDISTAEQALRNGEWKACTILAGAAIEALLLWRLKQADTDILRSRITFADVNDIEKWGLHLLLEASKTLGIIRDETHTQADLAKNFRNLIHPGKSIRIGQKCNKATALTALAALQHVINDLTYHMPS